MNLSFELFLGSQTRYVVLFPLYTAITLGGGYHFLEVFDGGALNLILVLLALPGERVDKTLHLSLLHI